MKRIRILVFCTAIFPLASAASAGTVTYDDGAYHVLSTATSDEYLVSDGPLSDPTTLEIAAGANLSDRVVVWEHSLFKMTGGLVQQDIGLHDTSHGDISAGTVINLQTYQNSTLAVDGGNIRQLTVRDDSSVDITNATFNSTYTYRGIYLLDNSEVKMYGSDFSLVDLVDDIFGATQDKFSLSGKFQDGTPFDVLIYFYKTHNPTLSLVEVPEPSGLALAAAAVVALAFSRGRKGIGRELRQRRLSH